MTILIVGGNGQVGSEIARYGVLLGKTIKALDRATLDITNTDNVEQVFIVYRPSLVINAAAYTAVDKAEQEIEKAYAINRDGAALLARVCSQHHIPLIHLSTDYVFDGKQRYPYDETLLPAPLSQYGLSKWQGEQLVREECEQHIILRVSGVFGYYGHNFVKTILRLVQQQEVIRIVADQTICPTPAVDIAAVVLRLAEKILISPHDQWWGTYHYCSADPTTWYGFTCAIVEEAKRFQTLKVKTIAAVTSIEYAAPALRPPYSVLNCEKIKRVFDISQPRWQPRLTRVIEEIGSGNVS